MFYLHKLDVLFSSVISEISHGLNKCNIDLSEFQRNHRHRILFIHVTLIDESFITFHRNRLNTNRDVISKINININ